jgi:signal transduction histidine kinase
MAMQSVKGQFTARELNQRARFDALRRRVFDDMGRGAARWRLTWQLPMNLIVVGLLVGRGEALPRALVQIVAVTLISGSLILRAVTERPLVKAICFPIGVATYFVLVATTGGLASPILVSGAIMFVVAALTLRDPPWMRAAAFATFFVGFFSLAVFTRTSLGALPAPLVPVGGWSTPEYVTISLVSTIFSLLGIYRVGCTVTSGYERAALELAERREELCSENEDRTRALEGMAARLAHEVKNPLAAIKGLSTHMARNAGDPKTAERLAIVAAEADRLQAIVDGFLSFSRGLDDLNVTNFRPFEVVRELAVLLEMRAQEAGVSLEVSGDRNLALDADARKLRQALLNVVLNAIQASPRDSVVRIGVSGECDRALITVHDDGIGMTPDVLERIRKPYFTTKEGGSGLGVAVARGLVEQHGGQLEFRSTAGKGTTVSLRMPMKAKACMKLPNPLRSSPSLPQGLPDRGRVVKDGEVEKNEPAIAGVR